MFGQPKMWTWKRGAVKRGLKRRREQIFLSFWKRANGARKNEIFYPSWKKKKRFPPEWSCSSMKLWAGVTKRVVTNCTLRQFFPSSHLPLLAAGKCFIIYIRKRNLKHSPRVAIGLKTNPQGRRMKVLEIILLQRFCCYFLPLAFQPEDNGFPLHTRTLFVS